MIKRSVVLPAVLLMIMLLSGCASPYSSKYSAIGFVHSNTSEKAYMSFYRFEGRMAFELSAESGSPGRIDYSGRLEKGSIRVFYDAGDGKKELFSLKSGEEKTGTLDVPEDRTVFIITETDGRCENGDLCFDMVQPL